MTCPSWVGLHSIAHSFSELFKPLRHDKAVIHEGVHEYFGHLMKREDCLEKTLMLAKDWGHKEKGTTEVEMVGQCSRSY